MSEEKNNNSKPESRVKKEELRINSEKAKAPKSSKRKKIAIASVVAGVAVGGVALGTILALQSGGKITVKYTANGKEEVLELDKNTKISDIQPNAVPGYVFDGWYKDPGLTIPYTDDDVLQNESILYPKFVAREYVVTYYSNDGSNRHFEQKVYFDSEFSVLGCEYDRDHYGFVGWSTNPATKHSDSNILFENLPLILDTEGLNLYAVWKGEATTVSFNTDNLLVNGNAYTIENKTVLYGETFTLPEIPGATHATDNTQKFVGYIINGDIYQPGDVVTVNSVSTVVEINWQNAFSALYFNMQAPTGETATPVATMAHFAQSQEYEYVLPTANDLNNYEFVGWNTQADGKGTTYLAGETFTTNKSASVLYAMWAGKARTIVILDDTGATVETITCKYGDVITLKTLTKENYDFIGYNTKSDYAGENLKGETTVKFDSETTTLYVHFTRSQAIVSFNANGGTGAVANISVDTFTTRTLTADEIAAQKLALKLKYYNLAGWSLNQDAKPGDEGVGFDIVVGNSAQTYFAVWQRNKVTVTYTTMSGDIVPLNTQADQGAEFVLTDTGFEREGYFVKEFIFGGTTYQIGDSISLMDEDVFAVEIQPVWVEETPVVFIGCDDITAVETDNFSDGFVNLEDLKAGDCIYLPKPAVSYIDEEQSGVASVYATSQTNTVRKYFVGWSATKGSTTAEYFYNDDSTMLSVTNNCLKLYPVYQEANLEYFDFEDNGDDTYTATYKGGTGSENLSAIIFPNTYMGLPVVAAENTSTQNTGCETRVIFPEGIKEINTNFADWTRILSAYLPESLTEIGSSASFANSGVRNVHIPGGVKTFTSTNLLKNTGSRLIFKEGITDIEANSFSQTNLVYVTLPSTLTTIGNNAFDGCSSLATVTIPEDSQLATIGDCAFYNCEALTSINIPASVTWIRNNAFRGCSSLATVTIPENSQITTIGNFAFYYCEALTSINIPASVTSSIGSSAFAGCSALATVTIPEDSQLTTIDDSAFNSCTSLTSITIPTSVISIGKYAFQNCKKLTGINIPASVTSIGEYTFSGCSVLATVTIPEDSKLKTIRNYTFQNCTSLTSINIPTSVTSIGDYAFSNCKFTSINIPASVTSIGQYAFDGCSVLATVTIPEDSKLATIGKYAFKNCKKLTGINIPAGVTSIGAGAFGNCTSLTSITIPAGVTSIGKEAFSGCTGLTTINYNATACADLTDASKVFYNAGTKGTGITMNIGANVTKIPAYLYYVSSSTYKPRIRTVNFVGTSQCTTIGNYAFANCTALTSITIPASVTSIGERAFCNCGNLSSFDFANIESIGTSAFEGCSNLTSIDLGDNVQTIGTTAFAGCSLVGEITIGENLTSLASNSFDGCSGVETLNINTDLSNYSYYEYLETPFCSIGASSGLTVNIGAQTTVVPSNLFAGNTNIVEVKFADGSQCTEIGMTAFDGCTALKTVNIPTTVQTIEEWAFSGCSALEEITIPENVTLIKDGAFINCTGLKKINYNAIECSGGDSYGNQVANIFANTGINTNGMTITIGENVYKLPNLLFYCSDSNYQVNVKTINFNASYCADLDIGSNVFTNLGENGDGITVNFGASVERIPSYLFYCDSDYFGPFTTVNGPNIASINFEEGSECEEIGDFAFINCVNIATISLPESLTYIGCGVFSGCTSLRQITIPAGVTTILEETFLQCTNLRTITFAENSQCEIIESWAFKESGITSITIPATVETIREKSFQNCLDLETVVFEEGSQCTEFGFYVFSGCSALTGIIIPEGVTMIGDYVFENCTNLKTLSIPSSVTTIFDTAFDGCNNIETFSYDTDTFNYVTISLENLKTLTIGDNVTTIPENKFEGLTKLTSMTMGYSVSEIGDYAFNGCSALTSATIGYNVMTIGESAFKGTKLETVTFEYGSMCVTIGANAFTDCKSLTEMELPEAVSEIGENAFSGCSSLQTINIPSMLYEIENGVFSGCYALKNITIPEITVSIGNSAFYGCDNLTTVTIAEYSQLTTIGESAFDSCIALTSITLPDSVTSIDASAFYNCTSLGTVTISEDSQLTTIGASAFEHCEDLTSIYIPKNVTIIDESAFSDCSSLATVTIPADSQITTIGYSAFRNCKFTSINIPASVTSIGEYAFYYCSSLATVTIPEDSQLTTIGDYVFYNCKALTSINIPASVTSIGKETFINCSVLATVTIPEDSQLATIGNYAFNNCKKLTSINIPAGVTSIGSNAFYGCSVLATVTIPEDSQLTRINNNAFYNCEALTSITIPASVTKIGLEAFYGCSGLTTINYNATACADLTSSTSAFSKAGKSGTGITLNIGANVTKIPAYLCSVSYSTDSPKITTVNFVGTSQCTTIGNYAFANCTALTSITIPASVTSISSSAFDGCTNIQTLSYNTDAFNSVSMSFANLKTLTIGDNVTTIPESRYANCDNLTTVTIGSGVTSIGNYAFDGCSLLATVTIPEDSQLATIGGGAFGGIAITSINIPASVTSIGDSAFYNCTSLTSINIPASVTSISSNAFEGCTNIQTLSYNTEAFNNVAMSFTNLKTLTIGDNVTTIPGIRYTNCVNLTIVTIGSGVTSIGTEAFSGCSSLATVTIPEDSQLATIGDYAFQRCKKLTSITIPTSVTSIGVGAFSVCSSLATVTIPEDSQLTTIGASAFHSCTSLTSINIPAGVTSIGNNAFHYCSSLATVTFPEDSQLATIVASAFNSCTSLTSITIPTSVTSIGNYAFANCTSLTSIHIPASVTSIGKYAFGNCTSLGTITFKGTTPPAEFGENWAPSTDTLAVIVVPAASKSLYETALGATYAAIIVTE